MFIKNFKRSLRHHFATIFTTFAVLSATFTIVGCGFLLAQNLQNALSRWGNSLQVTAYLKDDLGDDAIGTLQKSLQAMTEVKTVEFTSKEQATSSFKTQMASYAPGLLADPDFANPFPASLTLTLKDSVAFLGEPKSLEQFSSQIQKMIGIEDVSYGQSWISNYSGFVHLVARFSWAAVGVLFFGSLLMVGNSTRAAISARRDEIELLELVGATSSWIRKPYFFEGATLGFLAAGTAIILNFIFYRWGLNAIASEPSLMRIREATEFFALWKIILFLICGTGIGALGAYLAIRRLNGGWAAKERLQGIGA